MTHPTSERQGETPQAPELVFTLIHGTFAKGADWVTGKDPTFRQKLERALKAELPDHGISFGDDNEHFFWGNKGFRKYRDNSHRAREAGAEELKRYLRKLTQVSPARHFLVAHSHGGNVALHALKDAELRQSVAGLVCLATPFLSPRHRRLPMRIVMASLIFLAALAWISLDWEAPGRVLFSVLAVPYAVVAVTVIFSRLRYDWRQRKRLEELLKNEPDQVPVEKVQALARTVAEETLKGLSLGDETPCPLLNIRPSGDEALGLLRTSQFVTWILGKSWGGLDRTLGFLLVLGLMLHYGRQGADRLAQWIGEEEAFDSLSGSLDSWIDMDPVFAVLLGISGVVVLLSVIARLTFDSHLGAVSRIADFDLLAEDAPPNMRSEILVLPVQPTDKARKEPDGGSKKIGPGAGRDSYKRADVARAVAMWGKERNRETGSRVGHTDIYKRQDVAEAIARWVKTVTTDRGTD